MDKIISFNQIQQAASSIKEQKEGFLTNFFMSKEKCNRLIKSQSIFEVTTEKSIFILSKDHDFYHLCYFSTNHKNLEDSLIKLTEIYPKTVFVCDLIGKQNQIKSYAELFIPCGFRYHKTLHRMSRILDIDKIQSFDTRIKFAQHNHAEELYKLIQEYFDKYSEQLPSLEEINEWIEAQRILISTEGEKISGFVVFEIQGMTSILRYWLVLPVYREQKIGSVLLKRFFYECRNSGRQLLWVLGDNENAIKRYRHYGFETEELYDYIMIKE